MLDVKTKRAKRRYLPSPTIEPIFTEIARRRALCAQHIHALLQENTAEDKSLRSTRLRIQTWEKRGYLSHIVVSDRPPLRFFHVTREAYAYWPKMASVASKHVYSPPKPELAIHAWHRASLALAFRAEGYTVGRDIAALIALRRFLIDSQRARIEQASGRRQEELTQTLYALRDYGLLQPWVIFSCRRCGLELPIGSAKPGPCRECGDVFDVHAIHQPFECAICRKKGEAGGAHQVDGVSCPGTLRAVDYLPFDLAYKRTQAGYDVKVLLADHPFRSVATQLAELPLRIMGQTKVDVIVRPCEDGSVYDMKRRTYSVRGPRYRQYLRAFSQDDAKPDAFPYWMTANLLPEHLFPETHFRKLRAA